MDTLTSTKVVASLCGALLILLLSQWVARGLYHVGGEGEQAYVIDTGEDTSAVATTQEVVFGDLLASADIGKGARIFKKCSACHKVVKDANGTGPSLYGVVGRAVATEAGFGYSNAMKAKGGDWTPDELDHFLTKPGGYVPGTKMTFSGLKKAQDRADVVAYLQSIVN